MSASLPIIKSDHKNPKPWYHKGLRFECTGCGQCCTGSPGYVWISVDEIEVMAKYLNLTVQDFADRYLRKVEDRFSLIERPHKNHDCIFLDGKKCRVYPVRPKQCQTFPWWPGFLESPEAWQRAALECEGINDEAPVVPFEVIEKEKQAYLGQ